MQGYIKDLIQKSKTVLNKEYWKRFSDRVNEHTGLPHELILDDIMLDVIVELKNKDLSVEEFMAFKSALPIGVTDFEEVIDNLSNFIATEKQSKLDDILKQMKNESNLDA